MALNWYQKQALDNAVVEVMNELIEMDSFTNHEIINKISEKIDFPVYPASIRSSLERVLGKVDYRKYTIEEIGKNGNSIKYKLASYLFHLVNNNYEKERNILSFNTNDDTVVSYDFVTKKFTVNDKEYDKDYVNKHISSRYSSFLKVSLDRDVFDYEWLFNYTDDLTVIYDIVTKCEKRVYEKMPNGFYQYLQENDENISRENLEKYFYINLYGKAGYNIRKTYDTRTAEIILNDLTIKTLNKIITNNIKNGDYDIKYCLQNFLKAFAQAKAIEPNIKEMLDENRDLEHNYDIVNGIIHKKENEILEAQLKKLNFINGLTFADKYVIVVPQTAKDKVNEGKMQNNCVGYYYDNSIRRGENLIYFLRKIDKPTKSYITCRYNINWSDTVEYRKVNNTSVNDDSEVKIIKEISKIIRDNLNK